MPDNIVKKHIIAVLEDKRDQKDLTERIDYVISEDMPESLCHVIEEWVDTLSVSDEEIARFIGWSVSEVAVIRDIDGIYSGESSDHEEIMIYRD